MVYHRHPGKIKNVREHNPLIKFRWELVQSSLVKVSFCLIALRSHIFFAQSELSLSFVVEINQEGRGLEGVALHSEVKCRLWFSNLLLSTISPYTYFLFCFSKMKQIVFVSAYTQKSNFGGLCPIVSRGSSDLYKVV